MGAGEAIRAAGAKHEEMWQQLQRLKTMIENLEGFATKIQEGEAPPITNQDEPVPALGGFLNMGADELSQCSTRIDKAIACLDSLLFVS